MPTEADWNVAARLFAGKNADFRHHLGLARSTATAFYAGTAAAAEIRAQKQAVLDSSEADRYLVQTPEGRVPFEEFLGTLSTDLAADAPGLDDTALNRAATLALEPDYVLLAPADWRLVWASVCFPTRWSLAGKALWPLPELHAPVPGLNEDLGSKIGFFFSMLTPGQGWGRANWGLSTNSNRDQHPALPYQPLAEHAPLDRVYLRIESQHLAKLPRTGAIVFGIRILSFPLHEAAARPDIAVPLREQLRTMPAAVAAYKGVPPAFWRRL